MTNRFVMLCGITALMMTSLGTRRSTGVSRVAPHARLRVSVRSSRALPGRKNAWIVPQTSGRILAVSLYRATWTGFSVGDNVASTNAISLYGQLTVTGAVRMIKTCERTEGLSVSPRTVLAYAAFAYLRRRGGFT